jgi:tRNA(fMet)-specific endonuclease VapC
MAGKRLLDSSAVVSLFRGDEGIAERIAEIDVAISLVVLGELHYGIANSERKVPNLEQLAAFVEDCEVLELTRTTTTIYADLKVVQRRLGKMIPENDLWIAASTREHGLVLAHRDRKHFDLIPDLDQEIW